MSSALDSKWFSSAKLAVASLTAVPATAVVAFGLLTNDFITRPTTIWLIGAAVFTPVIGLHRAGGAPPVRALRRPPRSGAGVRQRVVVVHGAAVYLTAAPR